MTTDVFYNNNMNKFFISILLLLLSASQAFAWVSYQQNMSPQDFRDRGNSYGQNDLYSTDNNNHPYSVFQNVYDKNSARNNPKYSAHINSYDGKFQGNIGQQMHDSNSITNPYGQHGGVYKPNHPSKPYTPDKWNNPYSTFQKPYIPESIHNNSKYGVQYNDGYGHNIGATTASGSYNASAYQHSPFDPTSVQNPYGQNKKFK